MTGNMFSTIGSFCSTLLSPFLQWERLRHPWAGWLRVALAVLFPFVVWSHDWLLIGLLLIALFSHPYWFPAYVEAGEDTHCFTKMIDAWHKWMDETPSHVKAYAFFPGLILVLPLVSFLWAHSLFWSFYFFAAVIAYKLMFIGKIMGCCETTESSS